MNRRNLLDIDWQNEMLAYASLDLILPHFHLIRSILKAGATTLPTPGNTHVCDLVPRAL